MSLRVFIKKGFMGELAFTIFSVGNTYNEQLIFGKPMRKEYKGGDLILEPTFIIDTHQSSEFMYALKDAIRIFEGSTPDFSQGELKATKYHLEDLRRLLKIIK